MSGMRWFAAGMAALIGLALANRFAARRIARRHPPRGRLIAADGLRLHVIEQGEGVPVVLLHGASGTAGDFTLGLLDRLAAAGFRAIAIDRPGHGHSTRPPGAMSPAEQARVIRAAMHALGAERPVLLGHSWSGALVLAYALAWPQEIRGAIVVAGVSHPWRGSGLSWHARAAARPLIGPLLVHLLLAPLGRLLIPAAVRSVFAPDPPPPGYRRRAGVSLLLRPHHYRANVRDLAGLKDFVRAQSRRYGDLQVPLAILHGTADRTVSIDLHARALAAAAPRARLWVLEGAGHMPHHSRPEAVRDAVEWILAQG